MSGRNERTLRVQLYKKLLNYTCAHPECDSGTEIEAHHVRPIYKGGVDKFWNIISLCCKCHRHKKLHSRSEEKMLELYVYKSMHELKICGFIFDEQEESFNENLKKYKRDRKLLTAEEDIILENIENIKE